MPRLPLAPLTVLKAFRELRQATSAPQPLVLDGARELATALKRELTRGGDERAVAVGRTSLGDAVALVYVLAHELDDRDRRALREAADAGVPAIVLGPYPSVLGSSVLATDVLPLEAGAGFPVEELARLLGAKLDDDAVSLAARLPALRRGVAGALVAKAARRNAVIGAAVFLRGADFPVLTLNEIRLVLRIAAAYGQALDAKRAPEVVGVIAGGLGLRALARRAQLLVPLRAAVRGSVAYAGTRAVGEAAIRYFEARSGGGGAEPSAPGADRA